MIIVLISVVQYCNIYWDEFVFIGCSCSEKGRPVAIEFTICYILKL